MASNEREFDIVVFGATGVTGNYVVEELAKVAKEENIKWAVAGRSNNKLKKLLEDTAKIVNLPIAELRKIPIINASAEDQVSLERMCRRTKLVANIVGPYFDYGEAVIEACIKEKTSQVDVAAEAAFIELMQLKYHKQAQEADVYIVNACGLSSIPIEMGIMLLKDQFKGDLNSVEAYLELDLDYSKKKQVNGGTAISFIHLVGLVYKYWDLQKRLLMNIFTKPQPPTNPTLTKRLLKLNPGNNNLSSFLPSTDESCAMRSQWHLHELYNTRPTQVRCYNTISPFWMGFLILFGVLLLVPFCFLDITKFYVIKYLDVWSAGFFTWRKPSRKEIENDYFNVSFYGEGWDTKLDDLGNVHQQKPNVRVKLSLQGPDPAYITTAVCVVQSCLCILKEHDKIPITGVLPPGFTFSKTTLVERLKKYDIKYSNIKIL